jgi:hypothetical protein
MSWMNDHKREWREIVLVLLLVSIIGPWIFDLIVVPSEYACLTPAIRLAGDYCGIPMSGIWILSAAAGVLVNIVVGLVTGTTAFTDRFREFSFSLLGLLLILPFFSTLFMIVRGDRQHQLVFHVAVWCLAFGLGLLLAISSYPKQFWVLWGIWLYVGLAASALILEVVMLAARRRPDHG